MNKIKGPLHDEVDDFKDGETSANPKDEQEIYEDGNLLKITVDELVDNPIAIRQLMNSNNISRKELQLVKSDLKAKEIELSFIRTTPFAGILSLILNTVGSILLSLSINLITSNQFNSVNVTLLILGILCLLVGSGVPILYPYISRLYNRDEEK